MGFNLKATDLQAAIGCAQLEKLDVIVARRRANFDFLRSRLDGSRGIILPEPEKNSRPSWFGFLITVEKDAGFTRTELTKFLEDNKIQTRNLFAGNLVRHPAFEAYEEGRDYRVAGSLGVTDRIMNDTFWIGVYPGMTEEKLRYMADKIIEFTNSR